MAGIVEELQKNETYAPLVKNLLDAGQNEIFDKFNLNDTEQIASFFNQVKLLEDGYPGGIEAYVKQARKLLEASKRGDNPFEGYVPEVPKGATLYFNTDEFNEMEKVGLENADKLAFALVAGGLGERLGYSGIKVALPSEITTEDCYLKVYIESILALQKATNASKPLPLVMMTSDDTHSRTVELLEKNNYFGMLKEQITLLKQEKVASIRNANGAVACDPNDPYKILTKPHGHGDIHYLLHSSGTAQKWLDEGRTYILFFQDTNGLVFRSLLACLGVAVSRNFSANSITGPRKAKQAVGAICCLKREDGTSITTNVEYNQLDPLLRATPGYEQGDVNGEDGLSPFPGNFNQLLFRLNDYVKTLDVTKGLVPEFVNPKYADETRTTFKKPTRLECMMQDLPRMFDSSCVVGFTTCIGNGLSKERQDFLCQNLDMTLASIMKRDISFFSPVKNNVIDAAKKQLGGNHPACASSGEADLYEINARALISLGAFVQPPEKKRWFGKDGSSVIETFEWPHIVLSANVSKSVQSLKDCFVNPSFVKISSRSTLVIRGTGQVVIDTLDLDGALVIEACEGAVVNVPNLVVRNDSFMFRALYEEGDTSKNSEKDNIPEYLQIRGYELIKGECRNEIFKEPGKYGVINEE